MSMNETIIRFNNVSFDFGYNREILEEVSFAVRRGMKIALMGQNGAGKSTIFKIMTKKLEVTKGEVLVDRDIKVATAHQIMSKDDLELTTQDYFAKYADLEDYELKKKISESLDIVNLEHAPLDKLVKSYSGGQQARLLLAAALVQSPDLLLLDEPTNNLDHEGIEHLKIFLTYYPNTCIVISHDAEFLNSFTDGVLYLDNFTHKVEQYVGTYFDVVEQIGARIEKENRLNARMEKGILERKEKANFFAHKGGKMRLVAKKMRDQVEKMESEKVDVRKEDKTIRRFFIPAQENLYGTILTINSYSIMQNHAQVEFSTNVILTKKQHLLIKGPNGIGKSTLIESIVTGKGGCSQIARGTRIGYYRQDFSNLVFEDTVYESFVKAVLSTNGEHNEEQIRSVAAGFLITSHVMDSKIGDLSEGQKGLVAFAQLVLMRPGLLILDEPTNHINFRHLPVIAKALHDYEGAMILVSHVPEFVAQVRIDKELDLLTNKVW